MFNWFYTCLVPEHHRPVLRMHPLAFWFSLGVLLTGILQIVHPSTDSAAAAALPDALHTIFNVVWILGGLFACFGILRGKARYEAAGMILMGTSFAVYFLILVRVLPTSLWSAAFIVTIAIGCLRRAFALAKGGGYERVLDDRWGE